MNQAERDQIDRMCRPRGIAIFGNMGKLGAFAHSITCAHHRFGYTGKINLVSHKGEEALGLKIHRSLASVDGPVDLASISVPPARVPAVLEECLAYGVAGVTIHTSGFAETGGEGVLLQKQIEAVSARGIRVIGPNCFGIYSPRGGLTFLPGFDYPQQPGKVGMVFQSGGMANDIIHEASASGIRFSKVFSFGNGCDLDAVRLVTYLADDPETEIIAAYLEGIGDGREFLRLVRRITPFKPVVIWKGGLTPFGGRMTQSHTGSMGGEAQIWKGMLAQAGAVEVHNPEAFSDTLTALSFLKKPGQRIGLMGGGGAIGVHSADITYRLGLQMPRFSADTQQKLSEILPTPGAGLGNPVDMVTPALPLDQIIQMVEEIMRRESIDVFLLVTLLHAVDVSPRAFCEMLGLAPPQSETYFETLLAALVRIKSETGKEIVSVIENRAQDLDNLDTENVLRQTRKKFQDAGLPVFATADRALLAVHHALKASG
ncbi:MAG: CoA-binding protein [bacterium]